jgi:hypothetical protein
LVPLNKEKDDMRRKTAGSFAAVALAAASLAWAQGQVGPPAPESSVQESTMNRTVTGEVVSATATKLSIRTSDGRDMTFILDPDLSADHEAIVVGRQVRVEYRGERELQAVLVSPLAKVGEAVAELGDKIEDAGKAVADEVKDATSDNGDNGHGAPAQAGATGDPADSQAAELPETAGPLPLLLLAGLSLLGGGLGLSARRG